MNLFTFTFTNKELESDYQMGLKNQLHSYQDQQKWLIFMIFVIYFIVSVLYNDYWHMAIASVGIVLQFIRFIVYRQVQLAYDIVLLAIVMLINIEIPILVNYGLDQVRDHYIHGYFVAFFTLILLKMMNHLIKILSLICIYLVNIVFTTSPLPLWYQLILYFLFVLLVIHNNIFEEKYHRSQYFKLKLSHQVQSSVLKQTDVDAYVCTMNEQKNSVELRQSNGNSAIIEQNQKEFTHIIRNMKIRKRKSQAFTLCKQFITLEQYLFELYQQPLNSILSHELIGNRQQEQFKIQVVEFCGLERVAIVIINENKKSNQIEELSLRNKILEKGFDSFVSIFRSEIRLSLVNFNWIYNIANKRTDQKQINLALKAIQSRLMKAYNDVLNLVEFFSVDHQIIQLNIRQFDILDLINQSLKIVSMYDGQFTYSCDFKLLDTMIYSDYGMLKQLFLSLLYFVKLGSHQISIKVEEEYNQHLDEQLIKIKIYYQGPNLSQQFLRGLPVINPRGLRELRHNSYKEFQLDLPISLLLIRRLGPYNKVRIQQHTDRLNYLEFYLFRTYSNNLQILQPKSIHPVNYIITHTSQRVAANSLVHFYDLPSPRPHLFTDRENS